jgi:hypothetical protein
MHPIKFETAQEQKAFEEGQTAFEDKDERSDNPYGSLEIACREAWLAGYDNAYEGYCEGEEAARTTDWDYRRE